MPVYHISNFDVSAVQIDLSSNFFADNTLLAHYWVLIDDVNFNDSNQVILTDPSLNALFKNVFDIDAEFNVVDKPVYYNQNGAGATLEEFDENNYEEYEVPDVQFKDLGVIKHAQYGSGVLYNSNVYTNVTALCEANNANTSFNGKVKAIFDASDIYITGLREKMLASINDSLQNSDLGIDGEVPEGSYFGFKVVRNLDVIGTSEDKQIIIGVLLRQAEDT